MIISFFPFLLMAIIIFIFIKKKKSQQNKEIIKETQTIDVEKKNKQKKITKWVIIVFSCMFIVAIMQEYLGVENIAQQEIINLYEKIGISKAEYEEYKQIFDKCNLGNVIDIKEDGFFDDTENEKYYKFFFLVIEEENDANIFYVETINNKISTIHVNSYLVYQDGEVKHSAEEFLNLTTTQKNAIEKQTKEYIRSELISPSSANFSNFVWGRINSTKFVAVSTVEYKNAFGVELQTTFKVYYDRKANSLSIEYQ